MKRTTCSALFLGLLLSLGACSAEAEPETTPEGVESPGDAESPDETESPEEAEEPVSFRMAMASPTLPDIPTMVALENMRADGHDVDWVEVAEPELAIEGLSTGQSFQFSATSGSAALIGIQQGAPIKLIADQVGYGHMVFAQSELKECADLDGHTVGHHSEGSVGTAIFRYWLNATCPEAEPIYLTIGGSPLRYMALTSGEIDATLLPLAEVLQLQQESPDQFTTLANLGEEIRDVRPAPFYGNTEYMEANPRAVELFLSALLEVYDEINADYTRLIEMTTAHYPEALPEGLEDLITRTYVESGMFDLQALNPETMASTIEFFENAGTIEPGLTVDDVADFSYLNAAVAAAG